MSAKAGVGAWVAFLGVAVVPSLRFPADAGTLAATRSAASGAQVSPPATLQTTSYVRTVTPTNVRAGTLPVMALVRKQLGTRRPALPLRTSVYDT